MGDLQITKIPIVLMTLLLCSAYGNLYHDFIDEITANGASSNQRPLWLELGSQLKSLGSPEFKITNDGPSRTGKNAVKVFFGYGDNRFVKISFEEDDNYNKIPSFEFSILNVKGKFRTSQFASKGPRRALGSVRSYELEGTLSSCDSCFLNATIQANLAFVHGRQLELELSMANTPGPLYTGRHHVPSVVLQDLEKIDAYLKIIIPMKENIYVPRGAKADFVLKLKGNISNHCVPNCGEKAGTYIWSNSAEIGSFERVSSMSVDKSDMFKLLGKVDSRDEIKYDDSSRSIPSKIDETYIIDSTIVYVSPHTYYDGRIHRKELLTVNFKHLDTGNEYMKIRAFLPSKDHFRVELSLPTLFYGETHLGFNFNTTATSSEIYLDTDASNWSRHRTFFDLYCPQNSVRNGNNSANVSITPHLSDVIGIKLPSEYELIGCNKLKIWKTEVLENEIITQIYVDPIFLLSTSLLPIGDWPDWYINDRSYQNIYKGLLLREEKIVFTENGYGIKNSFFDVLHGSGGVEFNLELQNGSAQNTLQVMGTRISFPRLRNQRKLITNLQMSLDSSNDTFTAKVIMGKDDIDDEREDKVIDGKFFNTGIVRASKYVIQQMIPRYLKSKSFTLSNTAYQNILQSNVADALQTIARKNTKWFDYSSYDNYQDSSDY